MIAQTASGIIFWEYQRQRRNDLKKAAKEKAFEDGNNEDKRVIISCQAVQVLQCARAPRKPLLTFPASWRST